VKSFSITKQIHKRGIHNEQYPAHQDVNMDLLQIRAPIDHIIVTWDKISFS